MPAICARLLAFSLTQKTAPTLPCNPPPPLCRALRSTIVPSETDAPASIMLGIVVVVAWLSEIKGADAVQALISSFVSLAYIFASPAGLHTEIKPEVLPLAMAITVFYDRTFSIKTHGTRVLMSVVAAVAMHLYGSASSAPATFVFCLAATRDDSLRKNMTMLAVLVWWFTIGDGGTFTPLMLASTQFIRRPAALKHALRQIRAAHGPAYVLTLAQAYAAQPTLLSAVAASSSLFAATMCRPDNTWEGHFLLRTLTVGHSFSSRKRVHALLMITSTVAATVRCASFKAA